MKRLFNFECNCTFHKIEIEEFTLGVVPDFPSNPDSLMSICIYQHRSEKTGKLLKKPKLLADVVLDEKQVKFLKSAFKNE